MSGVRTRPDPCTEAGASTRRSGGWSLTAIMLLVGGMVCFGSATPVSALVGRHVPVGMASFLRMAVASAVLVPAALLSSERPRRPVTMVRHLATATGGACSSWPSSGRSPSAPSW